LEYSYTSGRLAIATSNLTGPTWDGAIVITDDEGSSQKTVATVAGANNLAWLGSKDKELILCSCDDGTLQIWTATGKGREECVKYIVEHDDVATSVSVHASNSDLFLSSSWDMTIKQWSISKSTQTTFKGHLNYVWDVEWNKKATDLFISASQDRTVKTWDQRTQNPTQEYLSDLAVYTVSWNPLTEYMFAFGDAMGSIHIYDTRNPQDSLLSSYRGHTSGVRKVRFSHNEGETWLASASDDTLVSVWNWKTLSSVYSHKHEDFVRGLAWHPTKPKHLVSGGWDKNVFFHAFQQ